jgi:hypothetical protein
MPPVFGKEEILNYSRPEQESSFMEVMFRYLLFFGLIKGMVLLIANTEVTYKEITVVNMGVR